MKFDFMDPTGITGTSPMPFMPQQSQTPADFLKSLQSFGAPAMSNTRVLPPAPAVDYGLNPGAAYGAGSGWGGDTLSKSFLANEGAPAAAGGSGFMDFLKGFPDSPWGKAFLGGKSADGTSNLGLANVAIGGFSALTNAMMGMKQYNLMKDQLAFSKASFAKNWEAQSKTINSQLEDRQAARVASNASAYQSVGDYMKKNGIKG